MYSLHANVEAMAFSHVVLLFLNYFMVILVAGQTELVDKDVEIIPGKTVSQSHPLDAKFAAGPQYANDIYGPPVSV